MLMIKFVCFDMFFKDLRLLFGFGLCLYLVFKVMWMYNGIDFIVKFGILIIVIGDGIVYCVECVGGFGNLVVICYGNGYEIYYVYMSKINVKKGDKVECGQVIGLVGSIGIFIVLYCYYEVYFYGKLVNLFSFVMDGLMLVEYKVLIEVVEIVNQLLYQQNEK